MSRTGFLSIIRSLVLCTQQEVYVIQVMLTACYSKQSAQTENLSETFSALYQT